ncbi:MAG: aminotransferase class I/II-fold pyridoxal phosphate-dependent enzyme [Cyclobacteriaceae bacterium]
MIRPADRLSQLQEYYFSKKLKEVARLKAEGKDIINMGIGSPDKIPHEHVISELIESSIRPDSHGYQPYQGIPALREAIIDFTTKQYHVKLAPEEILPLIGSKEGITHISLAYLNPEDVVLVPELGYPTYSSVTNMVQGKLDFYPLEEDKNWEPDWEFFDKYDFTNVKIMWLNYPHMPTGQKGSLEILERFVKLAQDKQFLLCHDNPYSFLQDDKPLSIFNIEGAKEVAVELNSLSKTFNMAGWRVGWIAGAQHILEPILKVKSNMDSGMFKPVQLAAAKALSLGDSWYQNQSDLFASRRKSMQEFLNLLECDVEPDQAGMFVWAKVGSGTADELCDRLLYEKEIFVTPGHIFGPKGNNYIRVSLCLDESIIQKAIKRLA